jgi:hypothetical protein
VRFLWAKGLNTKNIHKEMFPVYGVKYLSLKAIVNVSLMIKGGNGGSEVAETRTKRLLCCL